VSAVFVTRFQLHLKRIKRLKKKEQSKIKREIEQDYSPRNDTRRFKCVMQKPDRYIYYSIDQPLYSSGV